MERGVILDELATGRTRLRKPFTGFQRIVTVTAHPDPSRQHLPGDSRRSARSDV